MNILVIGNGFDLAHDLPTKYTQFLEFCKRVFPVYENAEGRGVHLYQQEYLFDWNFNKEIKEKLERAYGSRRKITIKENAVQIEMSDPKLDEMYTLIKDNIWIEDFLQCNMYQKENWIDFESEISKVIKSLDNDMHGLSEICNIEDDIITLSNTFLSKKYSEYTFTVQQINILDGEEASKSITFKEIRNTLLNDLNRLIRALEIYLCEYVDKIEIQKKSPDIEELSIDFILSFNYTHTFSKIYDVSNQAKQEVTNPFDYIHGEVNINNNIESNNMVLGIDEYLLGDRKNKNVEFIAFKKFYQRIFKGTGCEYKKWLDIIQKDYLEYMQRQIDADDKKYIPDKIQAVLHYYAMQTIKRQSLKKHNLYIFGHSLDITDKDVLRDLILNDNVYTTIFYPNKEELGRKIANLVKVIGQDELIRRTGGSTKTIEFKQQQDMIKIS